MKIFLFTIIGLLALQIVQTKICPEPAYRDDPLVDSFIAKLQKAKFADDILKVAAQEIPLSSKVFKGTQIVRILDVITFVDTKGKIIQLLDPFIQYLSPEEIVQILKKMKFSDDQLSTLRILANTLVDTSDANKKYIIDNTLRFQSDKEKAKKILDNAPERSCFFGQVTENVAIFVIDFSGSMAEQFRMDDGTVYSRIQYVKLQLSETIENQLKPFQKFNVIAFGSSLSQWKQEPVNATKDNAASALQWIKNQGMLGGTNIEKALLLALQTKERLEAIYLLTDGAPGEGITDVNVMKKALLKRIQERQAQELPAVVINSVSFMLGGSESQQARSAAQNFLIQISEATNGSYRQVENKSKALELLEHEMELSYILTLLDEQEKSNSQNNKRRRKLLSE